MAYTWGDYWFATKYVLTGMGAFDQGLATSEQIRDAEKAMPAWWLDKDGVPSWTASQRAAEIENEGQAREDLDADLDRLEHEQGIAAENWSGDRGAELERLELDPETHGERGRSEPPERGIEDDELEL